MLTQSWICSQVFFWCLHFEAQKSNLSKQLRNREGSVNSWMFKVILTFCSMNHIWHGECFFVLVILNTKWKILWKRILLVWLLRTLNNSERIFCWQSIDRQKIFSLFHADFFLHIGFFYFMNYLLCFFRQDINSDTFFNFVSICQFYG